MIVWVCSRLRRREFVYCSRRKPIFAEKPGVIFYLETRGRGVGNQGVEPSFGEGTEREEEENRGACKTLVLYIFWR
jgi:hypothetical protein